VVSHSKAAQDVHTVYCFGAFRLDVAVGSLTRSDLPTGLGPRAVGMLQVLLERSNRYVSKAELLDAAWPGVVVEEANLAVQMSAIRKVLAQTDAGVRIETLPRRGYRLLGTVTVERGAQRGQDIESQPAGTPHTVLAERDPFVGRRAELEDLARQWQNGAHLVTVAGTGGSGKTRLARHYALGNLAAWPGGVYFCDLSETRTEDGICFAVASALGVQLTAGDPVTLLGHAIASRGRCLLILDNFEQVSALASATVGRWLDRAALASFLVTSRERLHIAGEALFPLDPMTLDSDAIELFRVRAQAQRPEFWLDVDGAAAVKRIVELVDGLPLAIELAAARVRVLSLRQIAERMNERFRLLAGARGSAARQATMQAAIDWSWKLLTPWEQRALATCSVFEGSFTMRAAEAVLDLSEFADVPPVVDVIEALIDKSLLRVAAITGVTDRHDLDEPHFGMYFSVHEYAAEKLDLLGPDTRRAAEERHGRYFSSFGSEQSLEPLAGREEAHRHHALALAVDNLVAAFHRAVGRGDVKTMTSTYRAAWEVLEVRGAATAGIELGSKLPELRENDDQLVAGHLVRARALWRCGRTAPAAELLEAIIAVTSRNGDRRREAIALTMLASIIHRKGNAAEARTHLDRALFLHREVGNRRGEARTLLNLGNIESDQARFAESKSHYSAALDIYRTIGDTSERGPVLGAMAINCVYALEFDEAQLLFGEALEVARRSSDRRSEGNLLSNMANLADLTGRPQEALELSEAALRIHRQVGNRRFECMVLGNLGELYLARERLEEAARNLESSLEVAVEVGDRLYEGTMLGHLGRVRERQNRLDEARALLERSVEILRTLANRRAEGISLRALGSVLARLRLLEDARRAFASGAELLEQTSDRLELGKLFCSHARAELEAGNRARAVPLLGDAERLADQLGASERSTLTAEIAALRGRI
jgi:predicted ATPase/DNA-binding winged helix-turn-helix (wHTH) protein